MQYTHLGRTGVSVSRFCLGTMNFGPLATEEESHQIMDKALDLGINFFDTANTYGWKTGEGYTEQIIGRWLAKGGGRREKIVLATKCYGSMSDWPNNSKLSAYHIRAACEGSLKRLQTDHIDLYQMHQIDRETPIDEIWQAMELLVQQGKVIYIGSSNHAGWHIAKLNEAAKRRNLLGLVSEQCLYNLTMRTAELDVLPAAMDYGMGVIPYTTLASGILAGALRKAKEGRRAQEGNAKRMEEMKPQLEKWESLCKEIGEKPGDVALAWVLSNPAITAPIIGPRKIEQLEDSLRALDIEITPEISSKIDEIFPGPGAPSPEAWAW